MPLVTCRTACTVLWRSLRNAIQFRRVRKSVRHRAMLGCFRSERKSNFHHLIEEDCRIFLRVYQNTGTHVHMSLVEVKVCILCAPFAWITSGGHLCSCRVLVAPICAVTGHRLAGRHTLHCRRIDWIEEHYQACRVGVEFGQCTSYCACLLGLGSRPF